MALSFSGGFESMSLVQLAEGISANSFMLGQTVGLKDGADLVRKLAGDAFSAGDDTKAHLYREIAQKLEEASAQRRTAYDGYATEREARFSELQSRDAAREAQQ